MAARWSILRSPAEHGRLPACRASVAVSQPIAAVPGPWQMKRPKSSSRASQVPWAMISPAAASSVQMPSAPARSAAFLAAVGRGALQVPEDDVKDVDHVVAGAAGEHVGVGGQGGDPPFGAQIGQLGGPGLVGVACQGHDMVCDSGHA